MPLLILLRRHGPKPPPLCHPRGASAADPVPAAPSRRRPETSCRPRPARHQDASRPDKAGRQTSPSDGRCRLARTPPGGRQAADHATRTVRVTVQTARPGTRQQAKATCPRYRHIYLFITYIMLYILYAIACIYTSRRVQVAFLWLPGLLVTRCHRRRFQAERLRICYGHRPGSCCRADCSG